MYKYSIWEYEKEGYIGDNPRPMYWGLAIVKTSPFIEDIYESDWNTFPKSFWSRKEVEEEAKRIIKNHYNRRKDWTSYHPSATI